MKRYFTSLLSLLLCSVCFAQSVEQEVEVTTKDGITLRGTLTLPSVEQDSAVCVAIIVAGSGPTDRNGNNIFMQNNSLRMISEELAENGIATIRYDKRGVAASDAVLESAVNIGLYASDVIEWCDFVDEDPRLGSITLIGHSEGGNLSLLAIEDGAEVDKLILLASPGRTFDVIIKEQLHDQPKQVKDDAFRIIDELKAGNRVEEVPAYLNALLRPSIQDYLISAFKVDPAEIISEIDIPTLIIQGTTDIQIGTVDAMALSAANHDAEMLIITSMNHILKVCTNMDRVQQMLQYSNPSLPLHEDLVPAITNFIACPH